MHSAVATKRVPISIPDAPIASAAASPRPLPMPPLAMGASGIEMGTRFVATAECIAHEHYKQALVEAKETDTTIIERSLGTPGRVLRNPMADRILQMEELEQRDDVLAAIRGAVNQRGAIEGDLENGWIWSGQVTGLIHDVPTVKELLERMTGEAFELISSAQSRFAPGQTS